MIIVLKRKSLNVVLSILLIVCILAISYNLLTKDKSVIKIEGGKSYIAIVIDDFGNNSAGTEDMINMKIPITAAVMPFQPYTKVDAESAHNAGLEVIMHIPMEPNKGKKSWLGQNAITCDLSEEELRKRIEAGFKEIPEAVGINNHMGSKATCDDRVMNVILEFTKENNLFFLDSKTSAKSVVSYISKKLDVSYGERDVFLDGVRTREEIESQLLTLAKISKKRGYAVGIGHVGKEGGKATADAIKAMYPTLQKQGIEFVYLSDIIKLIN